MVTIKACYVVTPKEETPKGFFCLSECDQICARSHTLSIYVYNNNNNLNVNEHVQRMRESLSQILVHYYPLCGRLNSIEGGLFKLDCNSKGAMLYEAESTKSIDEYGDFSPNDDAIKELIPNVDYSQPIEELPLFLAQVTKFHGGDSIAIGTALYHTISDGVASIHFINSWAKLTRGDTLDPHELPFLDRTVFTASRLPPVRRFDHPEFKPSPLILGRTDSTEERQKKTRFALLKLTAEQVRKLKKNANIGYSESQQRPYSRFEAIGAHIWRCASIAREHHKNQPTVARTVVDVRNKVNPPLPKNYFGNALGITTTPVCLVGEMISKPLSYGAQRIREAVERVANDEYIRSQLDVIARGEFRVNMFFIGNPNIAFVSWMGIMPIYDADFGWGKPDYVGPGAVFPIDIGMIAPTPHGDGSINIFMHFQIGHIDKFINLFWDTL